jgi:hypothetical protein
MSGAVGSIVAAGAALFVGDVVDAGTTARSVAAVAGWDGFGATAISLAGAAAGVGAADAAGVVAAGIVEAVGGVAATGAGGVDPVRWTVNCFRECHRVAPEGDSEVAPPWSIVAPEVTVRSSLAWDRSKNKGDR